MTANKVGFLGAGRVVRILLEGWRRAGTAPADVVVLDPDPGAIARLQKTFPIVRSAENAAALVDGIGHLFLAVHPPVLADALRPLSGGLPGHTVVISLAPRIPISRLGEWLGGCCRIARAIPNAPSLVNAGFTPIAYAHDLSEADRQAVRARFEPLGYCPTVPEEHLEAYAVLTGMGPTYLWFQFQQLRELGLSFGLPASDVDAGVAAMIHGATQTLFASGLRVEEVQDLIPVRPMAADEDAIRAAYRNRLTGLYQKLVGK